jgi:hypothetical protein
MPPTAGSSAIFCVAPLRYRTNTKHLLGQKYPKHGEIAAIPALRRRSQFTQDTALPAC